MTETEINIAIAEACGQPLPFHRSNDPEREEVFNNEWKLIANYCHDLNAMHEAEKVIYEKAKDYCEWLDKVVGHHNELYGLTFATARQRALAFLKTLGLEKNYGNQKRERVDGGWPRPTRTSRR